MIAWNGLDLSDSRQGLVKVSDEYDKKFADCIEDGEYL
jgi:hypothetical protein